MGKGDDFRARCYALPETINKGFWSGKRQRHGVIDVLDPTLIKVKMPGVVDRSIFMIGGENFIAGFQLQGAGDDIDAMCSVWHKDELRFGCAEKSRQFATRLAQEAIRAPAQKINRVTFQFPLPSLI